MKAAFRRNSLVLFGLLAVFGSSCLAQVLVSPPNYTVTVASGGTVVTNYKFDINGVDSGKTGAFANTNDSVNFSLNAGATYIFSMSTPGIHPVDICTNSNTTSKYSGASSQAVSGGTIVKLTIPATNYPPTLYYICNIHTFYGIITVLPPQPPPAANIVRATVSSNVVLTFTGGTNTIAVTPQYNSNLVSGVWQPVPGYTNNFSGNGTNTISFNRLESICGPDVFLRISQAPN